MDGLQKFQKVIFDLLFKFEKYLFLSQGFWGKKATAGDFQLFGEAYEAVIKAHTWGARFERTPHRIRIYYRTAVEMYSKMLKLLKRQATPEHYIMIARAYTELADDTVSLEDREIPGKSFPKAVKFFKKSGEYYSQMINMLGANEERYRSWGHQEAGRAFSNAGYYAMLELEQNGGDTLPDAVYSYREATSHYSKLFWLERPSLSFVNKRFEGFIRNVTNAESLMRERGYQKEADQVATFIPDMMSKCQDSPHETAPAMPAGSFEIVQ